MKELHVLRELLMQKYGRDFSTAVMENRGGCVSDRVSTHSSTPDVGYQCESHKVVKKLLVETPSSQLVDGYLSEISKAYGVKWSPSATPADDKDEASKLVGTSSMVVVLLTDVFRMKSKRQKKCQRLFQATRKSQVSLSYLIFHQRKTRTKRLLETQTLMSHRLKRIARTTLSLWHVVSTS